MRPPCSLADEAQLAGQRRDLAVVVVVDILVDSFDVLVFFVRWRLSWSALKAMMDLGMIYVQVSWFPWLLLLLLFVVAVVVVDCIQLCLCVFVCVF